MKIKWESLRSWVKKTWLGCWRTVCFRITMKRRRISTRKWWIWRWKKWRPSSRRWRRRTTRTQNWSRFLTIWRRILQGRWWASQILYFWNVLDFVTVSSKLGRKSWETQLKWKCSKIRLSNWNIFLSSDWPPDWMSSQFKTRNWSSISSPKRTHMLLWMTDYTVKSENSTFQTKPRECQWFPPNTLTASQSKKKWVMGNKWSKSKIWRIWIMFIFPVKEPLRVFSFSVTKTQFPKILKREIISWVPRVSRCWPWLGKKSIWIFSKTQNLI